ncbi:DUF2442 domain-containing protein [bacterium]|nr:DUF2442 domain-containing protein [bacterium]
MSSSMIEIKKFYAQHVHVTEDTLKVDLTDGRSIEVPLAWFPRLLHGNSEERNEWRLIGSGEGIHWPLLDEDISIQGLLEGRGSAESQSSLKNWLDQRSTESGRR